LAAPAEPSVGMGSGPPPGAEPMPLHHDRAGPARAPDRARTVESPNSGRRGRGAGVLSGRSPTTRAQTSRGAYESHDSERWRNAQAGSQAGCRRSRPVSSSSARRVSSRLRSLSSFLRCSGHAERPTRMARSSPSTASRWRCRRRSSYSTARRHPTEQYTGGRPVAGGWSGSPHFRQSSRAMFEGYSTMPALDVRACARAVKATGMQTPSPDGAACVAGP